MNRSFVPRCTPRAMLSILALTLMAGLVHPPAALAYEQYSGGIQGGCNDCHGDFLAPDYISLIDGENWGNLHNLHRGTMLDFDCGTCHTSGGRFPVFLGSSDGGAGFPAFSCAGCHGRQEDAIDPNGNSRGSAAGLRQHHWGAGQTICADCHSDANPTRLQTVGEQVLPAYYFLPDAAHGNKPTDPCNPNGEEGRYGGLSLGLDNDGDGLFDTSDPDCIAAVCGNTIVETGEDCDDGNTEDGDCCDSNCLFDPVDTLCLDDLVCNGDEMCDGAGACEAGLPLNCDDGVGCTDDTCDEASAGCVNDPVDAMCPDDGQFCNGSEFCDAVLDCQSVGDTCPLGTICNEVTDLCDVVEDCGNGILEGTEQCDDGNNEDGDCCDANCQYEPNGSSCADDTFCNGEETCNGAGTCLSGSPVDCDDGVDCTADSCDEAATACANEPDDGFCADGAFCTGVEFCDPVNDCQFGAPPDCSDGIGCTDDSCDPTSDACANEPNDGLCPADSLFCNGTEFCDASADCSFTGDPCPAGETCTETGGGTGICEVGPACGNGIPEAGEQCDDGNVMDGDCCDSNCQYEPGGSSCADGEFCNGDETCDGAGACLPDAPRDCSDGIDCSSDACDEVNNVCMSTPNDNLCPDDGLFCTGQEICLLEGGCMSTGDPCSSRETCNEDTDSCDSVDGKVTVCHKGKKTHQVAASAVPAHLRHGDTLGPCN